MASPIMYERNSGERGKRKEGAREGEILDMETERRNHGYDGNERLSGDINMNSCSGKLNRSTKTTNGAHQNGEKK